MRFVPSLRLLLMATLLLPCAIYVGAFPEQFWVLPFVALSFVFVCLVDLYVSSGSLNVLKVDAEPVMRLARGTAGDLLFHIRSDGDLPSVLTLGLPLPIEFLQEEEIKRIQILGTDVNFCEVSWQVTARVRGIYSCPDIFVEVPSSFGLFDIRRRHSISGEIRVYPNLRRERRQMANLFLNRGNYGIHAQRMFGQGREYEQLREYSAGDSITDVHWKASAKRGELVTKTYQVERTQEIYLIIDHSRLSGLRSIRAERSVDDTFYETVLERYVTAASILGLVAEREGDHFGLVAYGRQVSRFVRASSGKQHGQVVQDALFDLKTEAGPGDLNELFTFLRLRLRRRALLIFLTDLSDVAAAESFKEQVALIAGQHYVIVNSIRRDGVQVMYENSADFVSIADEIAGHLRWDSLRELKLSLRAGGVQFGVVKDEHLSLDVVNQYLSVKQKQVL